MRAFSLIVVLMGVVSYGASAVADLGDREGDAERASVSGLCRSGYSLLWHDDFSSSKSLERWDYMLYNGCEYGICGWGNNEKVRCLVFGSVWFSLVACGVLRR